VKIDYSKYLGPNYEYTYDKAGLSIINHTTPFEAILTLALMWPRVGLLGKREALNIVGVAPFVDCLGYLVAGRDTKDSKEVRMALLSEIEER